MAPRKSLRKVARQPEVIEISSDSESASSADEAPSAETPTRHSQDGDKQKSPREKGITDGNEQMDNILTSPASAKLPVRVKDTGSTRHRHVSIEIPLPTSSVRSRDDEILDSGGGNEEVFKTPLHVRKHITFDSDGEEFVTPIEAPSRNPLERSLAAKASAARASAVKAPPAGAPLAKTPGVEAKEVAPEADEDDESDNDNDDAPPEAISSHAAETQLAKSVEAAAKAVEKQAAALKRKRKERDAVFKGQAEERKSTQKKLATLQEGEVDSKPQDSASSEKWKRALPNLLPLELLESDDEDDSPQRPNSAVDSKPKRRKLGAAAERKLAYGAKAPRDQKVGSTVFRVVANRGDESLAPRLKKVTMHVKEQLLKRHRVPQAKGGSFVKSR
ncbi:hypothetical protein B0T26DRAFT_702991 [Lasiosphaeria miniovina]|uniref:U3 snoRNA associated n=1 Tax=Lasiosphaeria miniovina TaxID=1954250 RepID=A0AA40AV46_9PEZI|nr:uncharacterized protein B0T26DRAFT_702991 [Lasiosphaeria miniovina]KAK0722516.1 hypothetical protein B0T26DRAFT_702991 [Lasiosphaeria miniovina]